MNEKEKNAIEYLKTRLYGNECCKYIDIAQEDLRIFVNLIDQMKKNINSLEKYSDEQEENIIEKNNNICNLEFQIEKLQKENETLKNLHIQDNKHLDFIIQNSISKQKVKGKIEKLNKKIDESIDNSKGGQNEVFIEEAGELLAQKRVLQELIEESEEK